ncbi:MAG TPA: hypothetical protein VK875_02730 [Euzebyales bacterium]|nr:hypothetical protein [Euzebyales bacterium]
MSTELTDRKPSYQRWATPLLAVVLGVVFLVAHWIAGQPRLGFEALAVMTAFAVGLLVLRSRSELVAGILDRRDERINHIEREASLAAGVVVLLAIIVAAIVEIARGHDGSPYTWLGALAAVTYLVSLAVLRVRR